jgi:peptidoglycan/xylan/chitin deacetylase (PgdA/CDA1 family)
VTATFMLTGDFVRDYPAQSKAIAAAGYRIGDHSVSHPYSPSSPMRRCATRCSAPRARSSR